MFKQSLRLASTQRPYSGQIKVKLEQVQHQATGYADQAIGSVKQNLGKAMGNGMLLLAQFPEHLQHQGADQVETGQAILRESSKSDKNQEFVNEVYVAGKGLKQSISSSVNQASEFVKGKKDQAAEAQDSINSKKKIQH